MRHRDADGNRWQMFTPKRILRSGSVVKFEGMFVLWILLFFLWCGCWRNRKIVTYYCDKNNNNQGKETDFLRQGILIVVFCRFLNRDDSKWTLGDQYELFLHTVDRNNSGFYRCINKKIKGEKSREARMGNFYFLDVKTKISRMMVCFFISFMFFCSFI